MREPDNALYMDRRAPSSFDDWQFIEAEAIERCKRSKRIYEDGVSSGMPHWFLVRTNRMWFERSRRLRRIRRRKYAIAKNLLDAIFDREPEVNQ